MSTDDQPIRPTPRRAGLARHLRKACPISDRPPLVLLPGGLSLTEEAWADLQQFELVPGVDAEPFAEQLRAVVRCVDALAAQADQALVLISTAYDRQRHLLRTSHQRRAAALASLGEAATSDSPVSTEELAALAAVAQSEDDADYAAASSGLRSLGHTHAGTVKVMAMQLAALVDPLDQLAMADRARARQTEPGDDESSPANGNAS